MNNLKISLLSMSTVFLFTACGGNKIDVLAYPKKIQTKVNIPSVCMPQYKSVMPTIAVVAFSNNSTFGKANTTQTYSNKIVKKKSIGLAGLRPTHRGVGVGYISATHKKSNGYSNSTNRDIDAKLSTSITGPLENLVFNAGGAKLFTRSDMDKIDAELKLQDSGLLDSSSVVKFGRTSGVKFILTGSIDNVEQNYRGNSEVTGVVAIAAAHSDKKSVQLLGTLFHVGALLTDGMTIKTKMTVRMLDVETGKIVFSKQLEGSRNIGKFRNPSYDQVVGAIKANMLASLPNLKKDLSLYLSVNGYITQIKVNDDDLIAQVNIGRDLKVEENQLFKVFAFDENEDPLTGKITCDVIETTTKLKATQQITQKTTWTTVEEGNASFLKRGQLVQKIYKKVGMFNVPLF